MSRDPLQADSAAPDASLARSAAPMPGGAESQKYSPRPAREGWRLRRCEIPARRRARENSRPEPRRKSRLAQSFLSRSMAMLLALRDSADQTPAAPGNHLRARTPAPSANRTARKLSSARGAR